VAGRPRDPAAEVRAVSSPSCDNPARPLSRRAAACASLAAIFLVRCYQAMLRPFLIGACKFHPTCSEYAIESISTHGLRRGGWLAARRVCRCHPFGRGGIDPVPPRACGPDAKAGMA
jgi:putative membrane protein insertion efficiency factor